MAQLTWRNVDAPNFSGSLDGIRTFGTLLNQSGKGLQDALGAFQTADQQNVGNQIIQRALQYNDPSEYHKAMADGTIIGGVDLSRVDPKIMELLGSRAGDLTKNANMSLNAQKTRYDFGRQVDGDSRMEAADPAIRAIQMAARSGDQRAMTAALQNPLLAGLRTDQMADVFKTAQASEGDTLGNQGKVLGNTQASYNLNKQIGDDAAQREAQDFMLAARMGSVSDRQYQELLGDGLSGLSPAAQRLVGSQLGLGQGATGAGRGGLPSAPGTAGTRDGNDYDVIYQFKPTAQPLTSMSMGEVRDMQAGMIKNQGASPVGRYQINQQTLDDFGPKVFGKDWRSVPMTAENQDKLGEAIFNASKSGNLKARWDALPDATPGAYKDKSWNEMKDFIAQREIASKGPANLMPQVEVRGQADIASRNTLNRNSQEAVNSLAADFDRAVMDNRGSGEVMNEALGKGGKFEGADRQWLAQQIELGQEYGRSLGVEVSPAMALSALSRSTGSGRTSVLGRAWDATTSWIGGGPRDNDPNAGYGINTDKYKSLIRDEYSAGKTEGRVAEANIRAGLATNIQEARKAADDAAAELMQARAAARRNPRIAAGLPRLEERLAAAQARQASLTMRLQENNAEFAAKRKVEQAPKQVGTTAQRAAVPAGKPKITTAGNPFAQSFNPDDFKWID